MELNIDELRQRVDDTEGAGEYLRDIILALKDIEARLRSLEEKTTPT